MCRNSLSVLHVTLNSYVRGNFTNSCQTTRNCITENILEHTIHSQISNRALSIYINNNTFQMTCMMQGTNWLTLTADYMSWRLSCVVWRMRGRSWQLPTRRLKLWVVWFPQGIEVTLTAFNQNGIVYITIIHW